MSTLVSIVGHTVTKIKIRNFLNFVLKGLLFEQFIGKGVYVLSKFSQKLVFQSFQVALISAILITPNFHYRASATRPTGHLGQYNS